MHAHKSNLSKWHLFLQTEYDETASDHALNIVVFSAFFFLSIHKAAQRNSTDLTSTMEGIITTALH